MFKPTTPLPVEITKLTSAEILSLQTVLKSLNYPVGELDGLVGSKTLQAFSDFKKDHYLAMATVLGDTTVKALNLALKRSLDKKEFEPKHADQPIVAPKTVLSPPKEVNWFDFGCPVSKYFTVGEVSRFSKERIVQDPTHRKNVLFLAARLDEIRAAYGKPIGVTSWYRPPIVNRKVGGATGSSHLTGSGVDIYPIGNDVVEFQKWLDGIWSRALGYGAKKGFVHLDLRPTRIRWNY